jgi:DeoR family fructose operon transcriptional repressor
MFGIERLQKIREIIIKQKSIEVQSLSELLSVSEVTIRRDLDKLEKEGLIIKTYGGAILNDSYKLGAPLSNIGLPNEDTLIEEKNLIGKIASNMIADGEVIFLGGGTTCLYIAKNIKERNKLKVITNDIFIAGELYNCIGIKVILTGGDLITSTGILSGPLTLKSLEDIFIDKAFISVSGVNINYGYTVDSYEEVLVYKYLLDKADVAILVADHSKFNKTGFTKLAEIDQFKKVVSNKQVPEEFKNYYFNNNIKLYTTYKIK